MDEVESSREKVENVDQKKGKNIRVHRHVHNYFKECCEMSSIQGLSNVVQNVSCFEKSFWLAILFFCLFGCTFMIYQVYDKWCTTPVLVSLATKETSIFRVPFPAVTICPETKISKTCVDYSAVLRNLSYNLKDQIPGDQLRYFDYMSLLCKADNHFIPETNLTKLDDYNDFLKECKSLDLLDDSYCEIFGEPIDCDFILVPVITDEGLCYTFNLLNPHEILTKVNNLSFYKDNYRFKSNNWTPEKGYIKQSVKNKFEYPFRTTLSGAKNSLLVIFFINKDDVTYSCKEFALQGIRAQIHPPMTIPRPSQSFIPVGLDRLTNIAVTPNYMTTTDAVEKYESSLRNCYFSHERQLKYFEIYTQSNCNFECFINYTIQLCGCVDFFMPRDVNTSTCQLGDRMCLSLASYSYSKLRISKEMNPEYYANITADCVCLPRCVELGYKVESSTGVWDWRTEESANMSVSDDAFYYGSGVKVFFKNDYFLPMEKSELYGITDFLSNVGGILGLFTGFSLFSLFELIYFLSVRLIENYRRHGHWAGIHAKEP